MESVTVKRQYPITATGQTVDIYYPPHSTAQEQSPAVVLVSGLSDIGAEKIVGCRVNEMESFISWGKLVAASGLIAVSYTTQSDPAADLRTAVDWVVTAGAVLGICAVLCYGFMLDLDGSTGVAEATARWRFVNAAAGRSVDDLPTDTPLFIARAGQDVDPGVNPSIDAFVAQD